MKRTIITNLFVLSFLIIVSPVFAQTSSSADVTKVQTFIQSIIQTMVTISGLVAVAFLIWGGFQYITSTGNPNHMDSAKRTIMYSAIGLAIVLGAYVLTGIIAQLAGGAFGTTTNTTP